MNKKFDKILSNSEKIRGIANDYINSAEFKSKTAQEQKSDLLKLFEALEEAAAVLESLKNTR